jgi:type I restriction-modification system DNA methylase subunit
MTGRQQKLFSEAQVHAVLDKILEALGFKPISDIERGAPIEVMVGRKKTTIFADKIVSTTIKRKRTALIIVEGKKPEEDMEEALGQGISYAKNYNKNYLVPYVIVSDGKIFEIWRSVPQLKLCTIEITNDDIDGIDKGISSKRLLQTHKELLDFTKEHLEVHEPEAPDANLNKFENLKPFESEEDFDRTMEYCATLIYTNDETSEESILSEILKILFVKKFEEDNIAKKKDAINRFTIAQWNNYRENIDPNNPIGNIITDKLFVEMREKFKKEKLFDEDKINLREETINAIVGILQNYSIIKTPIEIKGRVFESLLSKQFKGSRGQYFTPKDVVDFINTVSQPKPGEKIIDPCCGSGRFIIEAYQRVWYEIKERYKGDEKEIENKLYELKNTFLWGVDIDPRLVKIAKMNMIMHDDGSTNIYKLNSLKKELFDSIKENSFKLIMTNPPFGGMVIEEISQKHEIKFKKGQRSQTEFIKLFHKLLEEKGRVCTVIDDGILNTQNMKKLRTFIFDNFIIHGVFSLPRATFSQFNAVKSSILYLEKKEAGKKYDNYEVFMSIAWTPEIKVDKEFEKIDLKEIAKLFLNFQKYGKKALPTDGICFSVSSSILKESRIDPYYFHPVHKKIIDKISKSPFLTTVSGVADEVEQTKIKFDEFKEYTIISSIESTRGEIITDKMVGKLLPKGIKRVFKKGDIIVSRINAKIGCVGLLLNEDEVYATSEYYGFRMKTPSDSTRRFLQLQLRTTEAILQIRKYATGQYLRIAEDDFKTMQILFPPSDTQKITKPIESKIDQLKKLEGEIHGDILGLNDQILKESSKK